MSWTRTDISRNLLDESGNEVDVSGVKYQFFVKNDLSDKEVKISAIGNEDGTFTFDNSYNYVFCYGKEVDDFHSLDKQKLFTVNFSATQEIDRRQKIHKLDINNIKIDIGFAEDKIRALEAENVTLKARLDAIEARLNAGGL